MCFCKSFILSKHSRKLFRFNACSSKDEFQRYLAEKHEALLGGGFNYFLFLPLPGEMIQFDVHIFQMGWFNHQLVLLEKGRSLGLSPGASLFQTFPFDRIPKETWDSQRFSTLKNRRLDSTVQRAGQSLLKAYDIG